MWVNLLEENKSKYKTYITNFASLSAAFSQKSESSESENPLTSIVAPIVNSKFQETVFQKSFGAIGEDIANTSYDASLIVDEKHRYLVGIKSFGFHSGDQKIAQFKSNSASDNWEEVLSEIKRNSESVHTKEEADKMNFPLYLDLAKKISKLRNDRIASSKEQIRGFVATDATVEAVYHVLMPSKKGASPKIFVGETDYLPIDIENLEILGSTNKRTPTNFKFTDGRHQYKYTSADSQLYMTFNNQDIVVDSWEIDYVKDPFHLFENLHLRILEEVEDEEAISMSVSWMITNIHGEVEQSSGFNGFDGASKLSKKNKNREKRIEKIRKKYQTKISKEKMTYVIDSLEKILLLEWKTAPEKLEMKRIRAELLQEIELIGNGDLVNDIESMVYRPVSEMYIPIPNSRQFHETYPNFFGKDIGLFKPGTKKLLLPPEQRIFKLKFLPSGDVIDAYVNQDYGKGIQSYGSQDILGEWILRGVFQLKPREILTRKRLEEIGINAIRLSKFEDSEKGIGLEFIWIDPENPPKDVIGWISEEMQPII